MLKAAVVLKDIRVDSTDPTRLYLTFYGYPDRTVDAKAWLFSNREPGEDLYISKTSTGGEVARIMGNPQHLMHLRKP